MRIFKVNTKPQSHNIDVSDRETIFIYGKTSGLIDVTINLVKANAEAYLYGIFWGIENNTIDIKTTTNHKVGNTSSRVLIKGIWKDNSIFNYRGMIRIENGAQLSDAYLQNDNISLSDSASVNSSPQLEINADDVKASHGVTISTIDDFEKYYLASRGLEPKYSENLIISGFVKDIMDKLGNENNIKSLVELDHYE